MAAPLSSLVVKISADTASLRKDVAKGTASLEKFSGGFQKIATKASIVGTAIGSLGAAAVTGALRNLTTFVSESVQAFAVQEAAVSKLTQALVTQGVNVPVVSSQYQALASAMQKATIFGDELLIDGTGAYTTTYASVAFNGIEPLRAYVI